MKKKLTMYKSLNENIDNYGKSAYQVDIQVVNALTSYLKYIYEKLNEMSSDFELLNWTQVILYK